MAAGEFKAKCLSIMDEVRDKRTSVTITKNGSPVARLVPLDYEATDPILGFYKGKVRMTGDVIAPIYTDEEYEEFFRRKDTMYSTAGERVVK